MKKLTKETIKTTDLGKVLFCSVAEPGAMG